MATVQFSLHCKPSFPLLSSMERDFDKNPNQGPNDLLLHLFTVM
jgi:hypothetical protein